MTDLRLSPGSRLGPYKIVRLIAKGGMGEVYEAREELLHRNVALKVMSDEAIEQIHQGVDLFIKEGKALAQLNHPHVVTIYQLGYDKGIHYIAMEYVEGPNLEEFTENFNPSIDQRVAVFHKILLGVRALHRKGIIHRDLKPKNIVVQDEKKIKIVDFGVAYIVQDRQPHLQDNSLMGSSHYMSPEVAQGKAPSFQSDIWSLGIIFYQMLTKQRPFSGGSQSEILRKVREEDLAFDALDTFLVPENLKNMIRKMCSKKLEDRFQSVDEILQHLGENHTPSLIGNIPYLTSVLSIGAIAVAIGAFSIFTFQKKKSFVPQPVALNNPAKISTARDVASANQVIPSATKKESGEFKALELPETSSPKLIAKPSVKSKPAVLKQPGAKALAQVRIKNRNLQIVLISKSSSNGRKPASITKPPILIWQKIAEAESYHLQIATDVEFSDLVFTNSIRDNQFKWENAKVGTFYWRVKAIAKNRPSGEFSSPATIVTSLPKPEFKKSLYKFSGANSKKGPFVVDWEKNTLASGYRVLLKQDRNSNTPIKNEIVAGNKFSFTAKPGVYSVQVTALDQKREPASPSAAAAIKIEQLVKLTTPEILQPINGISVPSQGTMITPIVCSWTASKDATGYEFQLSTDSAFKKIEHKNISTNPRYIVTVPLSIGKFYWRVRAIKDEENQSGWSKSRTFIIN